MMADKRLTKCCCCISARTGALILGVLGLIGSLMRTGTSSTELVNKDLYIQSLKEAKEVIEQQHDAHQIDRDQYEYLIASTDFMIKYYVDYIVVSLIFSAASIVLNALLVGGISYNKSKLMLPYVVSQGLGLIFGVIIAFGGAIYIGCAFGSFTYGTIWFICMTIVSAIAGYFFAVICSVYFDVKEAEGHTDSKGLIPHELM